MSKFRFGWPDLLLPSALVLAVNGFFYASMAVLGLYAVLYFWLVSRRRRYREQAAAEATVRRLIREEDVAHIYGVPEDLGGSHSGDYARKHARALAEWMTERQVRVARSWARRSPSPGGDRR